MNSAQQARAELSKYWQEIYGGKSRKIASVYHGTVMPFPIKVCAVCGEEFELKPDKPGFANRCPDCSENDEGTKSGEPPKVDREANEARREAMKNLLYRKDS